MSELPNVLLIHADQHRGDCLGVEGHPVLQTPQLDTLACNGARFSHCYASCPVCIPARRTLMTGQSPQKHGVIGYVPGVPLEPGVPTLPGMLREAGYQTYHVGRSMHQSPARACYGFDDMELVAGRQNPHFAEYYEWYAANCPPGADRQGEKGAGIMHNDWIAEPWHQPDYLHNTNWTVDRALRFMERRDPTRPYFLSVGFIAPHPPLQPPSFYFERYLRTGVPDPVIGDWAEPPAPDAPGDRISSPHVNLEGEALLSARAGYYGSINHIDTQLRRLLNPIDGVGGDPNLIIIYISDHGEALGDHYLFRKSRPYECTARVPCIFTAPARYGIGKGAVHDDVADLADIMPTILDMVGIGIPESVDGCSLLPVMSEGKPVGRDYLHIEHTHNPHGLTDGHWKYIWEPRTNQDLLFDLDNDPQEAKDLSDLAEHAATRDLWRQRLVNELKDRPEGFVKDGELVQVASWPSVIEGSPAAGLERTTS